MFHSPENLFLLLVAGCWLALLLRTGVRDLKRRREAFADRTILERITGHTPTRRPLLKWALLLFAFVLLCLALARPIGGLKEEAVTGMGLDLVVALDISQSMQVQDIERYARLAIAKALLQRLMQGLMHDRVGLIVFAGDTMVQCPLTLDRGTFLTFLERVDSSLLTNQGTNLAGAIETSLDRFDYTASQSRAILLISDGEDHDAGRVKKAVAEAKRKGVPVFTVGIGSREGGPIPVSRDVWGDVQFKVHKGRRVISRLDDEMLKMIARETGAKNWRATDGASAQEVARALMGMKRVAMVAGTRTVAQEWFELPLLIAFLLLAVEWMISERIAYTREKDHWLKRL